MSGLPDRFDVTTTGYQVKTDPQLSVYPAGGGHLNAAAVRTFWDGEVDAFLIGTDAEVGELALVEADPDLPESYAFSQDSNGAGGDISIGTALDDLGIDTDAIEETQFATLEQEGDVVVADLSDLVGLDAGVTETDDGQDDADDAEDDESVDVEEIVADLEADNEDDDSDDESEADDEPDIDDDLPRDERLRRWLVDYLDMGESMTCSAGYLGDQIGEDGRAIPHSLKSLVNFEIGKEEREPPKPNEWTITRIGEDDGEADGAADEAGDDTADAEEFTGQQRDEVRYWCGFCGRGPFGRESQVEGHHNRNDHPGAYIPRTSDPRDDQLESNDATPETDYDGTAFERVRDWVSDNAPEFTYVKTEDVAIETDLSGNDARTALERVGRESDEYRIQNDGRLWKITASSGGESA